MDSGTQFDFSFAPGVSESQILGFEMAGELWSSYLNDDVTIQIHVDVSNELPENVVAGALPAIHGKTNYDKLRDKIFEDITTIDDSVAFENLPEGKKLELVANGNEFDKTKKIKLINATAKSLGIADGKSSELDGYIVVNDLSGMSDVGWNYDPLRTDSVQNNELDFLTVATHEIGHVLGFVSGIDDRNWLSTVTAVQDTNRKINDTAVRSATPLDLHRYSNESAANGQLEFSIGQDSFFSIDGGNSNLGNFSTGQYSDLGGDGFQASHWKDNAPGVMQPLLRGGVTQDITSLDLTALDVIGWDVSPAELDWQDIYDKASENVENAVNIDRSGDVQKLIRNNEEYNGRISRYGTSINFSWQTGFWQFNTVEGLDSPLEISEPGTAIINNTVDSPGSTSVSNNELSEVSLNDVDNEYIVGIDGDSDRLLSNKKDKDKDETSIYEADESAGLSLADNSLAEGELSIDLSDPLVMPLY